ncbi:MAG: hypothetical protein ACJ8KF_10870 [Chthoniobacterales bacterium]
MNQPSDASDKSHRIYFGLALVLFGCCGCAAHLATVETKTPRLSATVASEAHLGSATKLLAVAENEQPLSALGHNLVQNTEQAGTSIMGDRGRGGTPDSSDGIVPYWSSHLDGAQLELIVNSGHDAEYNPQAIREVERILKLNLASSR